MHLFDILVLSCEVIVLALAWWLVFSNIRRTCIRWTVKCIGLLGRCQKQQAKQVVLYSSGEQLHNSEQLLRLQLQH